jgi:hypothetical protein
MKNFTAVVFILVMTTLNLFGAKPIVEVPDPPTKAQLEYIEESEELFVSYLLKYYNCAVALRTQLIFLGKEPQKIPEPSLEDMTDQEIKLIAAYYRLAKEFEDTLRNTDGSVQRMQIDSLRNALVLSQRNYDSLNYKVNNIILGEDYKQVFKENLDSCMQENARKNHVIDSLKYSCMQELETLRENLTVYYEEFYKSTLPVLSASVAANKLYINSDLVEPKLSVSTELLLNCNPIFKYGRYFDIWASYWMPFINTKSANSQYIYTWKSDVFAAGVNVNIPKIVKFKDLHVGLKLGVGQFWGDGKIYNETSNYVSFYGQNLKFELNFGFASFYAPYEIYFVYSGNFHTNDFVFSTPTELIDLGKPVNNVIALGFRIPLIRFYYNPN